MAKSFHVGVEVSHVKKKSNTQAEEQHKQIGVKENMAYLRNEMQFPMAGA